MADQQGPPNEDKQGDQLTTEVEAVAMMIKLVGISQPYKDRIFPIDKPEFLVGRSKLCDLVLHENTISGKHARIVRVGEHYEVEDMGSTNGVFVNEEPIERHTLRPDDVIAFDEIAFRYVNPLEVTRTVVSPRKDLLKFDTVERPAKKPSAPTSAVRGKDQASTAPVPDDVLPDEQLDDFLDQMPREDDPTPMPQEAPKEPSKDSALASSTTAPLPVVVPDRQASGPQTPQSSPRPAPPSPTSRPIPPPAARVVPPSSPPPDPYAPHPDAPAGTPAAGTPAAGRPDPRPAPPPPPMTPARPAPPPPPKGKTSPDLLINPYQPAARSATPPMAMRHADTSGPMASLFTGLTFAVLFSFFGTFLGIWGQLKFSGDPMAVLKTMAIMFPLWHTHAPWLTATWNSAAIITAICLPLGPFLGGLLTQSMWRDQPTGTAAVFSVIYALGFISLQIVALDFQLDNVKTLPKIDAMGVSDPAMAILAVYGIFLIVTFVLSLLGTLAGKR